MPMCSLAQSDTPLIAGDQTSQSITQHVTSLVYRPTPFRWLAALAVSGLLLGVFIFSTTLLLIAGVGIWGVNVPVAWGLAIVNFVWWIGLGHAGTLISAILLLLRQPWRRSISRIAETMTVFALACAGLFPLLHMGRPWFFYWLLPYPNTMNVWPQFRSALVWDVFAILAYFTVSLMFWYLGMIPDLATMRDRAQGRAARLTYTLLAMGWRGESNQWTLYNTAYRLLAGIATVLVISVHSIVALDFAITVLPGWHSTIYPPYFVAGAMHSGFAMVLLLVIPLRSFFALHSLITERHLDYLAKLLITTSFIVGYGYLMEYFQQWYSGREVETHLASLRMVGIYAPLYWSLIVANVVMPLLLLIRPLRIQPIVLLVVSGVVLVGMWLERYLIVISALHQDYLPSSWGAYQATIWDWAVLLGTVGLFSTLFLLAIRLLPIIPMFEARELIAIHRSRSPS